MNGRRSFLALVGGAGAVTGSVLFRKATAAPTLILPTDAAAVATPSGGGTATPLLNAVLACGESQMHAFLDVKQSLSEGMFLDWLESGLRLVEDCKPGGGIFGTHWREAEAGQIPPPPKRIVGNGGRTAHEDAYLRQTLDNLKGSLERQITWSQALPIRQGGAQ